MELLFGLDCFQLRKFMFLLQFSSVCVWFCAGNDRFVFCFGLIELERIERNIL